MTNLTDLARMTGLSVSTVSRALAGKTVVAEATRERVTALAREHGVKLNHSARNLRLGRTGAIGVLIATSEESAHLCSPFVMTLLCPLADAVTRRGYDLLLARVGSNDHTLHEALRTGRFDGAILIGEPGREDETVAAIDGEASGHPPLVAWGTAFAGAGATMVGPDNHAAGRMAADLLLDRGSRRLAFLGDLQDSDFADRFAGFSTRAVERGEAPPAVVPVPQDSEAACRTLVRWLAEGERADGLFCGSDLLAMSALRALRERGLLVPDEVAVVGFGDLLIAAFTSPPLTTIREDAEAGAAAMVDILCRQIDGKPASPLHLRPELVIRQSA